MWISILNIIPSICSRPGQGDTPIVSGDFIELEPNLFTVALESGSTDKVELE